MSELADDPFHPPYGLVDYTFSKTFINTGDLKLLYKYGKEVHHFYLVFEILVEASSYGMVLVAKNINGRKSTVSDLIQALNDKLGKGYEQAYYSKDDSKYFLEDVRNKEMDLCQFAFFNLNPSNSIIEAGSDNRVYRLCVTSKKSNSPGPIVLEPARPPGESIGPLEKMA